MPEPDVIETDGAKSLDFWRIGGTFSSSSIDSTTV